jgi:hypothetical protein
MGPGDLPRENEADAGTAGFVVKKGTKRFDVEASPALVRNPD